MSEKKSHTVGHTTWASEGGEGPSQTGPKGRQLEVGAHLAPRLLVVMFQQYSPWFPSEYHLRIIFTIVTVKILIPKVKITVVKIFLKIYQVPWSMTAL